MNAVPGPRPAGGAPDPAPRSAVRGADPATTPDVPAQRTAADVYRVSEEQVHRARMAVARNALDSEDCRQLLDMLGLLGEAGEPPPVRR